MQVRSPLQSIRFTVYSKMVHHLQKTHYSNYCSFTTDLTFLEARAISKSDLDKTRTVPYMLFFTEYYSAKLNKYIPVQYKCSYLHKESK